MVPIRPQALIHHWCWHVCTGSWLSLSSAASLWCRHCELKLNPHLRRYHYDTVTCSRRKPRGKVQSCAGHRLGFGTRGVVQCKSCDVEIDQDAGSVCDTWGKDNAGEGGKKWYMYPSSCKFFVELSRHDNCESYPAFRWLKNTKQLNVHLPQLPCTSSM